MDLPYPRNSENCLILSRFPDSFLYKIHCVMENPSYLNISTSPEQDTNHLDNPMQPIEEENRPSKKSTLASLVPWRP